MNLASAVGAVFYQTFQIQKFALSLPFQSIALYTMRILLILVPLLVIASACGPEKPVETKEPLTTNSVEELTAYAMQQYDGFNYDSALYYIDLASSKDSQNFELLLLEGDVRWALADYKGAMAAYTGCLELNESKPVVWARLGKVYLEQNDYQSALKYFNQAINLDQSFADAYIGRATVFAAKNEMEQARMSLQTALDFDPDNYKGWLRMAKWQMADSNEIAIQCYSNALRIDSSDAAVFVERGMANFSFSYIDAARRDYIKATILNPEYFQAYFNLAYLLFEDGEYEKARDNFVTCTKLDDTDTDCWLGVALCEKELGNNEKASEALKKILEIDPNDPDAAKELEKLQ